VNVHQVYLVVQLGLDGHSCINRIIGRVYIQGHLYGEVMSAVPYMSGFIFRFEVLLLVVSNLKKRKVLHNVNNTNCFDTQT
jgi:hypothetical protein